MRGQLWEKTVCTFVSLFLSPILLTACGGKAAVPTYYLPPPPVTSPVLPALPQTTSLIPQAPGPTPTTGCSNSLVFIQDLTIPDYTTVAPGSSLDKQWQVQNNGSCNWDSGYRLRLVGGDALGATPEQALFPARAGSMVIIRVVFTAPTSSGIYTSEWQAFDPQGNAFGVSFFMKISVGQ